MIKNKNARKLTLDEFRQLALFIDCGNEEYLHMCNVKGERIARYDAQAVLDLYHASKEFDFVQNWIEETPTAVTQAKLKKIEASLLKRI